MVWGMSRRWGTRRRNLHWVLPQSKQTTWMYVIRALFGNHLWSVKSNEQLLHLMRECPNGGWAYMLMCASGRACVCVLEREVRESEGAERGVNEWKQINQRWGRERQIKGQDGRERRERARLVLKGTSYAPSLHRMQRFTPYLRSTKETEGKGMWSEREEGNEEVGVNWKRGNSEIHVIIHSR